MSLDRLDYSRARYNLLDLLAQFGGFMGIFRWLFTTFMAAWNTNALDNFMVSKLYKVEIEGKVTNLERSKLPNCGEYLMTWVPSPFQCCKKGKTKARARARALLNKEINMVKMVKM